MSDTSDKVVGLEVIPLSELGRPRIDVVSRISGLLRDTFPNIITLIDEAVRIVVALDESHEDNYVKKHYDEELAQLLEDGIDPETARQEAAIRVFGCPPGTYGGGVNVLVETKQWQNSDDLAQLPSLGVVMPTPKVCMVPYVEKPLSVVFPKSKQPSRTKTSSGSISMTSTMSTSIMEVSLLR